MQEVTNLWNLNKPIGTKTIYAEKEFENNLWNLDKPIGTKTSDIQF